MNSKIAKIIRRYAKLRRLDYTSCRNYFQSLDVNQQKEDIKNMKIVISSKGGENMANQKICDRPDKTIIGPDDDYLPLRIKQPDGNWVDFDLCNACANDFKAFTGQWPQSKPTPPEVPVAPVQPATPAVGTEQPTQ